MSKNADLFKSDTPLLEVLRKFNINIEKERICDIEIISINNLTCEIRDLATGTIYSGEFTSRIQNQSSDDIRYLKNTTTYTSGSSIYIRDTYRHIKGSKTVLEVLTILSNGYKFMIEKEYDEGNVRKQFFLGHDKQVKVYLAKRNNEEKKPYHREDEEELYDQIFVNIISESENDVMEQRYLGPYFDFSKDGYKIDEYDHILCGNLIHTVQGTEIHNSYNYSAICMENSLYYNPGLAKRYEPYGLRISEWKNQNPIDENVLSCFNYLLYLGKFYSEHILHILKYTDHYKIMYRGVHDKDQELFDMPIVSYVIPTTNNGLVNEEDICMLITKLKDIFGDEEFARIICSDLENFRRKMIIKKGGLPDVTSVLDPKIYISQSFDETIAFLTKSNYSLIDSALTQVADIKQEMATVMLSDFNR